MRDGATGAGRWMIVRGIVAVVCVGTLAVGAMLALNAQRAAASAKTEESALPAPGVHIGKSGLPVPRFVSLKAGRVNVRVGPGEDYKIAWVFTRAALPVEIIQEFDNWRRIRDSDGQVGWVFHSLLSGKRTAVVQPWQSGTPLPIHASAATDGKVTAYLQPGVQASIDRCRDDWCDISGRNFDGWIEQANLWGVYPGEKVE